MSKQSLHDQVTQKIIESLENGTPPWLVPWTGSPAMPANYSTRKSYNGINVLILFYEAIDKGYPHPYWLTYRQAQSLGAQVRKGEKGTRCIRYGTFTPDDERVRAANSGDDPAKIPFSKTFPVFNIAQIDGLEIESFAEFDHEDPINQVKELVAASGVVVNTHDNMCFYQPSKDEIHMVPENRFTESHEYYRTLLHELVHWTAHKSRCARDLDSYVTKRGRAFEELIAEMGCAFLCAQFGFATSMQHSSYIESWIRFLKDDPRAIFKAATAASKAANYLSDLIAPVTAETDPQLVAAE